MAGEICWKDAKQREVNSMLQIRIRRIWPNPDAK
jgi:hypothetical protein